MKFLHLAALPLATLAFGAPAFAQQQPDWLTRCYNDVGDSNAAETVTYSYETRGKVPNPARALADYTASASPKSNVYLTEAKDLMHPYIGASLSLGYVVSIPRVDEDALAAPAIGQISALAVAKGSQPIPGAPVSIKLVIDGVTFGPYPSSDDSSRDTYKVWFDTADTDGDGKPPALNPADFAKLAAAMDAMKTAEMVLVQDKTDIVRVTIPAAQRQLVRNQLRPWAIDTRRLLSSGCGVNNTQVN